MVRRPVRPVSRRDVLKAMGATSGVVAIAGCSGDGGSDGGDGGGDGGDGSDGGDGGGDGGDGSDGGSSGGGEQQSWRFGTSTEGSGSGSLGPAFGVLFEENSDRLSISAQNTQGFVHNQRLLDSEQVEIGFAHNIVFHWLYNEEGPFAENPVDVRPQQGWPTIQELNHCFVTMKDNGIVEVPDLAGESVSLGPPGGAVPEIGERVLRAEGVWEDVETTRMGFTEAISAYRAGDVAAFFTGVINLQTNPATMEAFETEDSDFIQMTQNGLDNLTSMFPFFNTAEIDTSHPIWPDALDTVHDTLFLPRLNSTAAIRPDLDDDLVYHALKTLHENQAQLAELNSLLWGFGFGTVEIEGEEVDRMGVRGQEPEFPFHPGAAEYLKEIDEWNDDFTVGN